MTMKLNFGKWLVHLIMILMAIFCLVPFLLLIVSSLTDEQEIIRSGYSLFPKEWSLAAYEFLWNQSESILRAYGITILVTVIGTTASLILITLLAYPLSRRDLPARNPLMFIVFFTLLFHGGLVPTYLVYTQVFDLKNTLLSLIVPGLLLNGFYVMLARTFFTMSIPSALIESASLDGAGEFRIFFRIVLPLSLPVLATIGLFQTINYWNDWFNGMIYLTDSHLFSLQNLLNRILLDIQFLTSGSMSQGNTSQALADMPSGTIRMAMAVIGILPIIIMYPFFQKFFVKGIVVGAVKG